MLLILFKAASEHYAIASHHIAEIVPYLLLSDNTALQPDFIIGTINYRGLSVPVIDLAIMQNNKPCRQRMSTRIILIKSSKQLVGLLAEEVTESIKINNPDALQASNETSNTYTGKQYLNAELVGRDMLQLFDPNSFLPDSITGSQQL